jgi:Tfp pilus assembly protein PilF
MSLLLDALKRAESQKKRSGATDNLSGTIPDIDFSAIDPVALQRSGAKNLFNAKQAGYDGYSKAKLIALLGGTALLLGAAGFYAWYWYNTAYPSASQISINSRTSPNPATGTPASSAPIPSTQIQPPPAPANEPIPAAVAQSPSTPITASSSSTAATSMDKPKASLPAVAKPTAQKKAVVAAKNKPPRVVTALAPKPLGTTTTVIAITSSPAPSSAHTVPPATTSPVGGDSIRLRRSNEEIFTINPELGAAYQALVAGNTMEAKQKYEMVLQQDPANIDAELGLATIAAKNNNPAEAARRYKRVLDLSPKNAYAIAGNAALLNDLPQTENQLRAQMAQQPQSAPLAAALGNVFASQNRWNEAQQAYFDATRIDANNPDYAFNLAVSLDQINQPKLALENYQKALTLANVRPSQFSKDAVATRIAELSKIR